MFGVQGVQQGIEQVSLGKHCLCTDVQVFVRSILFLLLLSPTVAQALPSPIERFLKRPFVVFQQDRVPRGFRIIVLSNLAEYCTHRFVAGTLSQPSATRCVEKLTQTALDPRVSPYREKDVALAPLGNHGLYLTHLNIVLAAHERVTEASKYRLLARRISTYLARRTLEASHHHVPSYASSKMRWPADQAATLHSLYLYDRNTEESVSVDPIAAWLDFMKTRGTNRRYGLHVSEVTGRAKGAKLPRGCALSWTVRYMASYAPAEAQRLWSKYKSTFKSSVGLAAGFREWPPGVRRKADIDSGPIVSGIGASATGLALGASRAVGDETTHMQLRSTAQLVRAVADEQLLRVGASILAFAIEQNGLSWTPWFNPGSESDPTAEHSPPAQR